MRVVEGGCSCGAVRFRLQGEVRFVAICHCDNCRRAHGAGGVEWAGYQEEQLEMLAGDSAGALEGPALRSWETPTAARRSFCGQCGSPLFFRSPRWAGERAQKRSVSWYYLEDRRSIIRSGYTASQITDLSGLRP